MDLVLHFKNQLPSFIELVIFHALVVLSLVILFLDLNMCLKFVEKVPGKDLIVLSNELLMLVIFLSRQLFG